eukprot:403350809
MKQPIANNTIVILLLGLFLYMPYYIECIQSLKPVSYQQTREPRITHPNEFIDNRGKIAFLFLFKNGKQHIPQLWNQFFKNISHELYSTHYAVVNPVHYQNNKNDQDTSNRQNFRKLEQLFALLEQTLYDDEERLNINEIDKIQKFVILSESSIPIYDFTYTYNALMANDKSYMFIEPMNSEIQGKNYESYKPLMNVFQLNEIYPHQAQMVLNRKHAELIVQKSRQIYHFWSAFKNLLDLDINELAIGTFLADRNELKNVENLCIQYRDTGNPNMFSKITKELIIDAQQRCLFLADVQQDASVDELALEMIFGNQINESSSCNYLNQNINQEMNQCQ